MEILKKNSGLILGLAIAGVVLGLVFLSNKPKPAVTPESGERVMIENTPKKTQETPEATDTELKLEGKLEKSDNPGRGNLMLITKETRVYLYASKDFSGLVGKNVTVEAEGSIDNFRLIGIKEIND